MHSNVSERIKTRWLVLFCCRIWMETIVVVSLHVLMNQSVTLGFLLIWTQVIVIQTRYRQWHAKRYVDSLREQKRKRLDWEEEQELKKIREKEEWMQMDYYRRHNPKTSEDFELLYNALERKCCKSFAGQTGLMRRKRDTVDVGTALGI